MSTILRGRYIRPSPVELLGETALLQPSEAGGWIAQFDDLEKFSRHETDWAFGWHSFTTDSFSLMEVET